MNKNSFKTKQSVGKDLYLETRTFVVIMFLVVSAAGAYWGVKDNEFVNYDDDEYVTQNSHVQAGLTSEGIVWAFTTTHAANWHPLTWLSHMFDYQLFGPNPQGHHLTSLLLHILNSILLFLVLRRMTDALWQSAFVAVLFALHPLHVESVAWVAERKDILSTFFWILTMWAYVRYVERPGSTRYLMVALPLALGLMAKPMLVTLPFVLLLLDIWPLGRIDLSEYGDASRDKRDKRPRTGIVLMRLAKEKIPLFALVAASCLVTFAAQRSGGAVQPMESLPFMDRVVNAIVSYFLYIEKMVWPTDMAFFYPYPVHTLPLWQPLGAGLLLLVITVLVIRTARRKPFLLVGWFWYLGTLIPVIGLVQVGGQAMADRYTYVPYIGLFMVVAWGVPASLGSGAPGNSSSRLVQPLLSRHAWRLLDLRCHTGRTGSSSSSMPWKSPLITGSRTQALDS